MKLRITAKRVRREGVNLDGRDKMARILARRPYAPGQHGPTSRTRQTDYGKQLREKQRAKLVYGIMERQFSNYFEKATNMKGDTGENLVRLLEQRLDNVLFRGGFAKTRAGARQIVSHNHVSVNGKAVNIPSFSVKIGDVIAIRKEKQSKKIWKDFLESGTKTETMSWVTADPKELVVKVVSLPAGDELKQIFDPKLIVEFYSR
ncbi:30S ribosomal protein S4 [Patescibacteria group bacterium]|jgi:small subunit ribosomal protein S4|nr:30S ribosomal protein S4 [Patescibacteria group bacterium]